jgi:hypothetical protein
MRTYFVPLVALMTVTITSVASSLNGVTDLTEGQVRTVCGKQLGPVVGMSFGCTKDCGDKHQHTCDYSCNVDANGKAYGCKGIFIGIRTPGGKVVKGALPSRGILDSGSVLGTPRPSAVGSPLGGGAAPAGPALR